MSELYETTTLDPPRENWAALLKTTAGPMPPGIAALRQAARRRLVDAAQQFVLRLHGIASESGLPPVREPLLTGNPDDTALVVTGHQPVIFHPGLVFKYETTEAFAAEQHAIAVAVVIDTDEGDAGEFTFPAADPGHSSSDEFVPHLRMETASFGTGTSLLSQNKLRSPAEIITLRERVTTALQQCGLHDSAATFAAAANEFTALKSTSAMDASLIVRRQHGIGSRMLELPLSAICSFPEVLQFFAELLTRGRDYQARHNQLLDTYRADHKLKNTANPFPNLGGSESLPELPFWIVDHQSGRRVIAVGHFTQESLELQTSDRTVATLPLPVTAGSLEALLLSNLQLIPRGALITATLRILFSDLFVHGTGGGRYDRFTDLLIRDWWSIQPTPFAIASGSRFLFDNARRELQRLQALETNLRDLMFNTQRHLRTGVFPPTLEEQLVELVQQKSTALQAMALARKEGRPAADIGRTIQQLTDKIRELVQSEFTAQLTVLQSLSDSHQAVINNRTWPWFLFE